MAIVLGIDNTAEDILEALEYDEVSRERIVNAINTHDLLIETLKVEHGMNAENDEAHSFIDCLVCSLITKAEGRS